ncbi:MAG: hypothetical protein MUF27_09465 [Acidobacteria bacterium]|nr:hypothetical protein [Acidobacteriota bacterium]
MQFGTKLSLGAALEAAQDRKEFVALSEIEERLPELLREAKAIVRSQLSASFAARGIPAEHNLAPADQVETGARGLLLGLVAPGEQRALSALLFGKGAR